MKRYVCDLCRREIKPSDIRMSFDVDIDGKKTEEVNMHSHCYYNFMNRLRDELTEEEREG